jgi:seryl-tRNA synthetase
MPILSEMITRFVGQKVKDIYGREFGLLVNVYSEIDGSVNGVEVSTGNEVITVDPSRFKVEEDRILALPEWKAEANRILALIDKSRRRQRALEELYNKGEVTKSMYDEMKRKIDSEFLKLKDDYVKLRNRLKSRLNEIDDQLLHIERVISMLKMNYIANEVPESSYKLSIEVLRQAKETSIAEKDDLRKTLDRMESIDKESMEVKPVSQAQEFQKKEDSQIQLPIPVKVINSV